MSLTGVEAELAHKLTALKRKGMVKGREHIVVRVSPGFDGYGPRYYLQGQGNRAFLRMNSNSYLGLSTHPKVIAAEGRAAEVFGTGPGAVRFISGTYQAHIELEQALAGFHGREAAMIYSAAYTAVMGVLPQLITGRTLVISDALNHSSIINAIHLARPADKQIYVHADMVELADILRVNQGKFERVCVVTDGVFSMRGDHAPLVQIIELCQSHGSGYPQGVITIVDDSHGVGVLGVTGRGTEQETGAQADVLIATLGKAVGVNGGYICSSQKVIDYLRETSPFYIYSNPITPGEAAAALQALEIIDSQEGLSLLVRLRELTGQLRMGLKQLGFEILQHNHPIVPILIRDTEVTTAIVEHLFEQNILVTGLNFPVVPQGEQEIRLQVSASHTPRDIAYLLKALASFDCGGQ